MSLYVPPRSQRLLWELGDDSAKRCDELAMVPGVQRAGLQTIEDALANGEYGEKTEAAVTLAFTAPGLAVSLVSSLAIGATLGYCAGTGAPVDGQGLALALVPVGGAGLSCLSPLLLEYGLDPLKPLASAGAIGSAVCLCAAYSVCYAAGRLTS